jgi:tRNA(Glu) U13 pseudouridine synthase TruD
MMVDDLRWRLEGNDLKLECFLGPGGYATTLLRELVNTSEPAEKLKEIEDDVREN